METVGFTEILIQHTAAHPSVCPQDIIKLCYQAAFGAEHLLTDEARARAYLAREWDAVDPAECPMWEDVSERYARVNIAAWKRAGLPCEWLFRMFFLTASVGSGQDAGALGSLFDTVERTARDGTLPFTVEEWCEARRVYEQGDGGAVHHSEAYRRKEHPAYRVVDRCYVRLIPLLQKLAVLPLSEQGRAAVIAIDGRAASGKTTVAKQLGDILGAGIVHMDDFFLPPELRTSERLAEAGGNVHYERFAEQVLPRIRNNEAFTYPTFNCSKMQLDGEREVIASPWRIVEGSYSHHPALGDYMDVRVFCYVDSREQMRRILRRNGERMARMFAERWIPMEEKYFEAYGIRERAEFEL